MLRRNTVANLAGQAWTAIMAVAFVPVYIRFLGVEAYGVIGLFTVLQAWLTLLDMGITPTLNREMARFRAGAHTTTSIGSLLRTLEILCFAVAVVVAGGLWVGSSYLAHSWLRADALPPSVVGTAIALMGVVAALRLCEGAYRGALLGLQRQVFFNSVNAVLVALRFGGAVVVLAYVSTSVAAFFVWQAIVSAVAVSVFAIATWREVGGSTKAVFSWSALKEVESFAKGIIAITGLGLLLTQVDKILLSRMISLEAFGYYSLAATVAGVLFFAVGPITFAVYPQLVELTAQDAQHALAATYHRGAQMVVSLVAPAGLVLVCFSAHVVYAWSGDPVLADRTGPLLSVLALGTTLNALMYMPVHLQLAHAWTSLSTKVNLVAVLTFVPVLFWVVPRFGALGAAWVWVALNSAYLVIGVQLMHRRLLRSEQRRWYVHDTAVPFLAALSVVILAMYVRPGSDDRLLWGSFLAVTAVVAALASVLLSDQLRPALLGRLRSMTSGMTGRV